MRRLSLVLAVAALGAAPPAYAQEANAPPGNSGVDEYLETVPGAGGNRPARPGSGPARRLPSAARREVAREGAAGERLAAIAEATAPPRSAASRRDEMDGGRIRAEAEPASSPLEAAAEAVTGSQPGGMGAFLPALLIGTAVLGGAFALRRRLVG